MNDKTNKSAINLVMLIKIKFLSYILAFKPLGWLTGIAFMLLGEWFSSHNFPLFSSIYALLGSACIAFFSSLINNLYDKQLDIFSRKPSIIIFRYISSKEMIFTAVLLLIIGLFLLWYVNIYVFIVGLSITILSVLYSAPPVRLKIRPPFDSVVNSLLLAPLPFFLGWTITGEMLTLSSILYAFIFFLFIMAYVLVYTSYDIKTDERFGIVTSCTKLGLKWSVAVATFIFILSLILSVIYFKLNSQFTISILIGSPFFLVILKKDAKNSSKFVFASHMLWMIILTVFLFTSTRSLFPLTLIILIFLWAFYVSIIFPRYIYPQIGYHKN